METDTTSQPSCSLAPGDLGGRLSEWVALMAEALDRRIEDGRVRSRYPDRPELRERLTALTAAEAECCSFLEFEVSEHDGHVEVELRFPPAFAPMLARLGLSSPHGGRKLEGVTRPVPR